MFCNMTIIDCYDVSKIHRWYVGWLLLATYCRTAYIARALYAYTSSKIWRTNCTEYIIHGPIVNHHTSQPWKIVISQSKIILCIHPANGNRCYIVTSCHCLGAYTKYSLWQSTSVRMMSQNSINIGKKLFHWGRGGQVMAYHALFERMGLINIRHSCLLWSTILILMSSDDWSFLVEV